MKSLLAFVSGALVGGIIALSYSPKSGKQNRKLAQKEFNKKINKLEANLKKQSKSLQSGIHDTIDEIASKGKTAVNNISDKVKA